MGIFGHVNEQRRVDYKKKSDVNVPYSDDEIKDHITNYELDTNIEVIADGDSVEELEKQYDRWMQMTPSEKDMSDNKSLEMYGVTNKQHYETLKSRLLAKGEYNQEYIGTVESVQPDKFIKEDNYENTYQNMEDIPYFDPDEMVDMGVFRGDRFFKTIEADNVYIDEDKKVTSKMWFNDYKLYSHGIISENKNDYSRMRINTLHRLYSDFDKIKESGDMEKVNARKQSILELGWNPEINFSIENRMKVTKYCREKFESRIMECIDMTKDYNFNILQETNQENDVDKYPIYVVLTYTGTLMGRVIRKVTKGIYTHAAFALDSDLKKTYSFNGNVDGFSLESIDGYKKAKGSVMAVYAIFVSKKDLLKIKTQLDNFLLNRDKYGYGFINLLGFIIGKPVQIANRMVCSQFVDSLLKTIKLDITHKQNGLISPIDFYNSGDNRLYKVYEGYINEYDNSKVDKIVSKIKNSFLTQSALVNESKEFPVQFDNDGNLLIKNMKKLDYEIEYSKSHKLLKSYEDNKNIDGMAYELSKLWFMNTILEKKIYNSNIDEDKKKELHKTRSRILNDFNKYLKIVCNEDKDFNFTKYYNETPFSDASIKISKHTISFGAKLLKSII